LENVSISYYLLSNRKAQRLAAQLLGRLRFAVTILTGKLKPHIGVRSLSLGQVSCSRVLGVVRITKILPFAESYSN
jgi:hypothetical protein